MNDAKKRQMPPLRRTAAAVVLLLLLGLIVTGLVVFQNFSSQVTASNHRLPRSTRVILPKRRSIQSQPQLLLVRFDQASLFVRTNPSRQLVSILSVPSTAYAMNDGKRETIANAYASGGTAGLIHLMRSAVGLTTTHVAVVEPNEVAPLVDAVGGVEIRDPSYALGSGRGRGGAIALEGLEARRYLESAESPLRRIRERVVLDAVVARLMSVSGFSTMTRLAREFPKTVATDLSPQDAAALAFLRLRVKSLVECGAEGGSLVSAASQRELQQFLGRAPAQAQNGHVLPESGCRASQVASAGLPAPIVSVASATLSIFPLLPAIAIGVVALDLLMLLLLLRVPHLLVGFGRVVGPALVGAGIGRVGYGHASAGASTSASGVRHRRSRLRPPRRASAARRAPSRTADAPLDQSPAKHPVETRSPQRLDPAPLVAHRHRTRRRTRSRSRRMLARAARVRFSRALSSRLSTTAYRATPIRPSGEPAENTRRRHPLHRFHRLARKMRSRLQRIVLLATWRTALGVVALSSLIGYLVTRL